MRRKLVACLATVLLLAGFAGPATASQPPSGGMGAGPLAGMPPMQPFDNAKREAAAKSNIARGAVNNLEQLLGGAGAKPKAQTRGPKSLSQAAPAAGCPTPSTTVIDYSGTCVPNYANSPLPGGGGPSVTFGGPGSGAVGIATVDTTGAISGVTVTNGGSGYTAAPSVTIGGSGTGALGTAVVTGGVTAVAVQNGGSGFTAAPISFVPPDGKGSGAAATATIKNGTITAITVTNPGSGYTQPPSVVIGSGGGGAAATASGPVDAISVVQAGSGYTAPTVSFTPVDGNGSGAAASATLSAGTVTGVTIGTAGAGYTAPSVAIDVPASGVQATAAASGGVDGTFTVVQGTGYAPGEIPGVTIDPPTGVGTQATATALADASGNLTLTLTDPGSGYTAAPLVTIAAPIAGGTTATATATIGVSTITVTNPGSGYTAVPNVTVSEGGTTTPTIVAVATASVSPVGAITGFTITNGGSGYTRAPQVAVTDAGPGTGALAAATIAITSIQVTAVGSGYTSAPTVTVADTPGAPKTATVASATVISNVVAQVTVTTPGAGYISPTVVFTGGGGSTAAATATVVTDVVSSVTVTAGGTGYTGGSGGIRKFVDTLPGLGPSGANDLGQYIPVAVPDTTTYPGSDYYEIAVVQYREQMHKDLPPTLLRGYVQLSTSVVPGAQLSLSNAMVDGSTVPIAGYTGVDRPSYLGPVIVASKDRPVRILFRNLLPTGVAGDLFIPVDTSVMGAGTGALDSNGNTCDSTLSPNCALYTQNRATLHLHGGLTPWISDGTPFQWTTPASETTPYPKGVSVQNVPDMPDPGPGAMTFFYSNQQSARLMFYHDHAYGITRLNVYSGEAAGYLLTDPAEQSQIASGLGLGNGIPLVIQDKTFVPNAAQLLAQDPTWNAAAYGGQGNLWYPHVYMPNQNPADQSGANAMGRWDYALWFFPPYTGLLNHDSIANPQCLIDPAGLSCSTMPTVPGTPNPSLTPEAFMDTPVINGTAYPVLQVQPQAYRFRILNAANDRMWNLSLYQAASNNPMWNPDGTLADANAGEVPMVPAVDNPALPFPSDWKTASDGPYGIRPDILDGRASGVPNPNNIGPSWVQLGTEGGVLPHATTIPPEPTGYQYNLRNIVVLNVSKHSLFLGPAERADVVVDFSQFAGKTLILYNDAPAPVPASDPRNDYYTGDPDLTAIGGAPSTLPGYGPNTRTIMQIQVAPATPAAPFNTAALNTAVESLFATTQPAPVVPEAAYGNYPNTYVRIQDTSINFTPANPAGPNVTLPLQPKAIQELFELNYGRMNATLGVELPFTNANNQTTVPLGYAEPVTEVISPSDVGTPVGTLNDGTQIWKITHNGVDTHAIHFHLFNVQLINRVGWDGAIRPPDANELGWKETVRMSPLEDAIVALRPVAPALPFGVPDSVRAIDPTMPLGVQEPTIDPITGTPGSFTNALYNYGWEYVWHCHLLGHEENDMMRAIRFDVPSVVPDAPVLSFARGSVILTWQDPTPNGLPLGNPKNEVGFKIERATYTNGVAGPWVQIATALANATTYTDKPDPTVTFDYRVIAWNAAGSTASNVVHVDGLPSAPTTLTAVLQSKLPPQSVLLNWINTANNATNVVVDRAVGAGAFAPLVTLPATANSYLDAPVTPGDYSYRVYATNTAGNSGYAGPVTITVPNPATSSVVLSAPNPSVFGQSVTFTATVTPAGTGTPTGTVTFTIDGAAGTPVSLSGGQATFSTSALAVGSHPAFATYSGDTSFLTSTSATITHLVNQAATTTLVSSSGTPSVFGQSVTFTATVGPTAPGAGTPTGSVQFTIDGVPAGAPLAIDATGVATLLVPGLSAGSHNVFATYGGDTSFLGSTNAPAFVQVVSQAPSTTSLASNLNPSTFGQSVTFTATVSPASATGTVSFSVNSGLPVVQPVGGGVATYTTSALPAGSNSIVAVYTGDASYLGSTSSTLTQVVNQAPTTTVVVSSVNPSILGSPVTFTATVSPASATGSVTFTIDGVAGSPVTLVAGQAAMTTSALAVGAHPVFAVYGGDASYLGSTSPTITQTVGPVLRPTNTVVTSNRVPSSVFGQSVTFTATVTPQTGTGVPTGTVQFSIDGASVGAPVTLNATGRATYATTTLVAGSHSVIAVYSGSAVFAGSGSAAYIQLVNPASTTVTLSSSRATAVFGQSVTFTAVVRAVAPGGGVPTGTVQFRVDGAPFGAPQPLNATGRATLTTAALPVGVHSVVAAYGGSPNYVANVSAAVPLTVNKGASRTVVTTSGSPAAVGSIVTFTAAVTAVAPATGVPTGTVQFRIDGVNVGAPMVLNPSGQAAYATNTLTAGTHFVSAVYSGDAGFSTSTAAQIRQRMR